VDLNLGCPQKCAQDGCFGAFLAESHPELAIECVAAMRRAIDDDHDNDDHHKPLLSCKMRLMDTNQETISFAKKLQAVGCQVLALHCRRRTDKHNGTPDLETGKSVVDALSIPVIINGAHVTTLSDIVTTLETTQADSIMIGRAFLTNPQLMSDIMTPQTPLSLSPPVPLITNPAILAAEYIDCCEKYPPPSPLYIQKHLRWIFRDYLAQESSSTTPYDYSDWRFRLWTFLVRPYLKSLYQFRQVVVLYVKLDHESRSGSTRTLSSTVSWLEKLPESLQHLPEPSFKSIRHASE
jgi:tRNA-dihydrouridine synthase